MHNMYWWCSFLIGAGLVAGNLDAGYATSHSEGPRKQGAFIDPDGNRILIDAGDVGSYETGMYDDTIDYENDVKFFLYSRENSEIPQQLYLNNLTSIDESNLNASRLTKILIHGFEDNLSSEMIQVNKDAFLANYNVNVIAVDWSPLATNILYPVVVSEVPAVGKYVGEFIEFLVTNTSVRPAQIHIVGHSLGAHVSGFAGKYVQSLGYNVSRISGLDAALPGYCFDKPTERLSNTDADYVDCIHTCSGFLGFMSPICQADFYPNGGTDPQPGCSILDFGVCSHGKSWKYFAASVNETNVFESEKCKNVIFGFRLGCSDETALMGYPAGVEKYGGVFYLRTTADYPYAEDV